jgi:endonuclease/exonuclease/phosphatase (EEP) superfamily protein YafD
MESAPTTMPVTRARARILDRIGWGLSGAAALALPFAYLTPFDLRDAPGWTGGLMWAAFLIRTVAFHVGWFFFPVALLAWWKKRAALAGFTTAVALAMLATSWRDLGPAGPVLVSKPTIRVLCANLFAFNGNHAPLVKEIQAADADVLVLEEYTGGWHADLHTVLDARYPFQSLNPREHCHGIAFYSRIQPVEPPQSDLIFGREGAPQVRAVLPLGGRRIVLYGLHTLPPNNLAYFREQCLQVESLLVRVQRESEAVIVVGDLNFTNASELADRFIAAGLSDVHWQAGAGRGATWVASPRFPWLPGIRIDHVYVGPQLGCVKTIVGRGEGSDHRPIIAEIGFRPAPP